MAERIADNPERIVDEMKRKARRRLVGAIVLALAAAIIVPMLLEKEPRPLGDDVSVQIPPVDEGRFVNRLTGKTGAAPSASPATPAASASEPAAPRKSVAEAELRVIAPSAKPASKAEDKSMPTPKSEVKTAPTAKAEARATPTAVAMGTDDKAAPTAKTEAKATPSPETKGVPKADAGAAPSPDSSQAARPAAAEASPAAGAAPAAPSAALAEAPAKAEGFVVQLAAFADDKGANALANKLKKSGYAAFVQPVETSRGTLWRVRVGGYGSRSEADAARATLKGEGYSGIVAPAQ